MAKTRSKVTEAEATPGVLPLPEAVVAHHHRTLEGPMKEWLASKRIPPVLLLTGSAGVGKRQIAYFLAQWITCERTGFAETADAGMDLFGGAAPAAEVTGGTLPCDECIQCQRALKGSWVDFTEVRSENEDEGSKVLKVDQFRDLKASMGFGAHEGKYRIILIPNADRMTQQAANSVLKLLEEPPAGWIFFLTASDPTLVLPTVLSRCQTLRLKPFSAEDLVQLLVNSGVGADRARICAHLAQGSWGKALSLARDEVFEQRENLFQFLKSPGSELNGLVDWATSDASNFDLFLDQMEHLTSELVRWTLQPKAHAWLNTDGASALSRHAQAVSRHFGNDLGRARSFWIGRAERLAEIRQQALAPLNRKLLAQDFLLPWLEASAT